MAWCRICVYDLLAYGSDPRGWLNLAGHLKVWYSMADHAVDFQTKGDQVCAEHKV